MDINNTTILNFAESTTDSERNPVRIFFVIAIAMAVTTTNILNLTILRKTKQIPEIAKICLLNLSIADLTSGLVCMTPCIASAILDSWPYGDVWCQVAGIFHGTCCSVSIWSLSVVSVDRYIAIKQPLRYHTLMTERRCVAILAFLWSFAFATFLLPVLIADHCIYYRYIPETVMCGMYWEYEWLCIVSGIYIPVASGFIIVYTSAGIIKETVCKSRRVAAIGSLNTTENSVKSVDLRAVKILCITAGMYFGAWGPYVFTELPAAFTTNLIIPGELQFWFIWLANSNSFMNVFIYCMIYKSFRQRAKVLLLRIFCCKCTEGQFAQTSVQY